MLSVRLCLSVVAPLLLLGSSETAHAEGLAPAAMAAPAAKATVATGKQSALAKKQVGAFINAIRFDKRTLAGKYLGFATMAKRLLGPTWSTLDAQEQASFAQDFRTLLVGTAFPKGHELFQYLDGILFGPSKQADVTLLQESTIVVHRNLKKVEMAVTWVLAEEEGTLKIIDLISQQESTTDGIREQEVLPLLKEGGKAKLLTAVHNKAQAAAAAP